MRKLLLIALLPLAGCIGMNTEFQKYEGHGNVYEGRGGTKAVIDGMEIWDGEPPRKYKLLGVIKDERPGAVIPQAMLRGDMVEEARKQGGDALINMGGSTQFVGTMSSGFGNATTYGNSAYGSSFGATTALRRTYATFAVIKYLN